MSWIDIGVGSGGSDSSSNLLSPLINSLGNALNNIYSWSLSGFPWQVDGENSQIVGYYDDPIGYYSVIKKFLAQKNYHSNERLKNALERVINIENRFNQLNHEIRAKENAINSLNSETHHLNNEIHNQTQAINNLNHEIAGLNNGISAQSQAIKQEEEKLNALELQTNAKKQIEKEIKESLKRLEKLKQELKRLKKQPKWEKQFNFLADNPPNLEAQQQHALNQTRKENSRMNFFLTNPYAILPKGFIYEYHNPGKETYNALNAPNNMDGINNQFRTNALNQVLDNSYQKFLPGNDSYNALGGIEQVKALKFYDLAINHAPQSDKLESALFFKQISQYAKGLRLKILSAPSGKKDLARLKKLENTINQEKERLKGKDLNALEQEILKEQENALKLKESIKAKQNYTETLKNAINQKEQAKKPIEQQKQNLESQRNEKEREKQNQEHDKHNKEQERNNINNEINAIGNERLTFKQLGTPWNFLGIQPFLNNNGWGRTYARAFFSDKNKSIREYYELETRIKNILGFYRIGESDERVLQRFLQLSYQQQNELAWLLLQ
ncbi:putative chromosome segregation protein [Helicobacter phage 1961P]|uniref:Putative chromosome segregation protein n=1 Tax=Helicobacter phage 1961P TaxID=1154995 RepID=I6P4A8_9CAUD|nr:UV radiation resistance protein [Helicobacter phage 1961P]AFC61909.1 putative chromosome segregation protein [Helicobacter phage 1961P]